MFSEKFENLAKEMPMSNRWRSACRIVAKKVVRDNLALRRKLVGELLRTVRLIGQQTFSEEAFEEGLHTVSSEPYFRDTSYKCPALKEVTVVDRENKCLVTESRLSIDENEFSLDEISIAVDDNGRCYLNLDDDASSKTWKCDLTCRTLDSEDKQIIIDLKNEFCDDCIDNVRDVLQTLDDGCQHGHFYKFSDRLVDMEEGCDDSFDLNPLEEKKGHPLPCSSGCCTSRLYTLRAAAVHYPILRTLLNNIYRARRSHCGIRDIESGLSEGSVSSLKKFLKVQELSELLDDEQSATTEGEYLSTSESCLEVEFAAIIETFYDKLKEDPEYTCCSCQKLLLKKVLTSFNFTTEKFKSSTWEQLKNYLRERDPEVSTQELYICKDCRPVLNANNIPARSVLNGLYTEPVPEELANLTPLETQFIQRAKCFQTVVRLGTYTGKVPIYNRMKAVKGTMFFLPLPLQNTLDRLDEAGFRAQFSADDIMSTLPDPELYIIVDGRPTKDKVVWQSIVDVDNVRHAVEKLKETNWLYRTVDESSVDEATKKTIEVASIASNPILERASVDDINGLQAYTIRKMDQYMPTGRDIEHYKLLSVHEQPLDNRQKHLDVLCFPTLFPTGRYGEFHPRSVKLTFSEYLKSRLMNSDSRFRKSPEFVFYYLWQKELRELSSGIYNVLKSSSRRSHTVKQFVDGINSADAGIEANLSTVLQSVRGTKQFWFRQKGDVLAMIREFGCPTLFLTFSCAEYDSVDIDRYLRKVNKVPKSYPIERLCIEDPISVSRKFSQKFHDFFDTVLIKGAVLGEVTHSFWKKEYQSRGAPHYHVLLWIKDAPVIGVDPEHAVTEWISKRISCHIPDEKGSPELHRLVTKYQLHKCSNYCRRKKKYGSAYVTHCKFGFPREVVDETVLNNVEDSLKSRSKVYHLQRSLGEERVNDYNPLLLYLWKANLDIQYVADSSLALAHYVTAYVTKAEKSHMQELWEDISEQESLYKKLWSFGVRSLRSRECGLYEAADILLGEHLYEKSDAVQWISIERPDKRKVRIKGYRELQQMAESDPDSNDLYQANLIDNFYPNRPASLGHVCLYDFVKWYRRGDNDAEGRRQYVRAGKPKIPNHRIYDPNKPDEREAYFYSLLLLFVPFTDESELVGDGQTAEEAFNEHFRDHSSMEHHHESLQKMLQAQAKVRRINEARKEEEVPADKDEVVEEEGVKLVGEAEAAMHDVHDMDYDTIGLSERIAMLNEDQRRIFEQVSNHLNHQRRHESNDCKCKDIKPLHMFVSGVGGTGKSFLIETIRSLVKEMWKDDAGDDTTCAVAAPTGLAAYNVGGVTVHRLFQLPIEHEGKTAGYWSLSKVAQKVMRTNLRSLKLIIIDEVSMLSSLNLAYIHLRLEELFGGSGDDYFGSMNMLFVGDILQLPPVTGSPVFSKLCNKLIASRMGSIASVNIWKESIVYDELTKNERQKKDGLFVNILDQVRRGSPTTESLECLKLRVINVPVVDKYAELSKSGSSPVCLFPTRKACREFNDKMLSALDTELHKITCIDEIDETSSSHKWTKKAQKQLEKLNNDSNSTAGLEAELTLAVGARVMLRRNIDTKRGLVNGAIGTVRCISSKQLIIKFDHMDDPCPIEMVRGKFMLLKSFFVYRKQFPVTVAYAVTIHKCQGLSLDCAIVDLSDNVFCAGMAYVAMSRVRTLEGLHLTAFDPKSIIVNNGCLEEVNRLRSCFRKDLPLYEIPVEKKRPVKRPLLDDCEKEAPAKKKPKGPTCKKRSADAPKTIPRAKKANDGDCEVVGVDRPVAPRYEWTNHRYYPVDVEWQRRACEMLGIRFVRPFQRRDGGSHVILTRPDLRSLRSIGGDGNCLFRALCYIISGSEGQHEDIRSAIVAHMLSIPELVCGTGPDGNRNYLVTYDDGYSSVEDYLARSGMAESGVWGGDFEMCILAHLLHTPIYSFQGDTNFWLPCFPHGIDRRIPVDVNVPSMYIILRSSHFQVVTAVRRSLAS